MLCKHCICMNPAQNTLRCHSKLATFETMNGLRTKAFCREITVKPGDLSLDECATLNRTGPSS